MKKKNYGTYKQFLHVIMIQSCFKYLFATSVKYSDFKISPLAHNWPKYIPFVAVAFIPLLNGKLDIKSQKKQIIIPILILNSAFYIYDNMRLKDIGILKLFEQIQENTILGSAFSARQLGCGFHT